VGKSRPYIPQDQLMGDEPDLALAADILELTALLLPGNQAQVADLVSDLEIGQDEYEDPDEIVRRDSLMNDTAAELESRAYVLGEAYPFVLSSNGATVQFNEGPNWGRTLYVLSLILSHLPPCPVLERANLAPNQNDIVKLRRWFQYCAAASIAGEIVGNAWAFGWPRPDGRAFLQKLQEIWESLKDGDVIEAPSEGSPEQVKDDGIDIIAARPSCDERQGFPIILGQVASGQNWREKSIRCHAEHVFYQKWFRVPPASQTLVYHIVPFVVEPDIFQLETRRLGHLMHRVRLCRRAWEACNAESQAVHMQIEGTESFHDVDCWVSEYRS
jgi:hypothetical protein